MADPTPSTPSGPASDFASASRNPALAAALRDMEEKKSRSPWRKWLMISGISLVVLGLIAGGAWAIKAKRDRNEKERLLASVKEDPRKMREAVDSGKITRDEGRDAMRAAGEERMDKQMDAYFALKTPTERNAYLDKMIDEQQARRREWEQRAATRPSTQPRRSTTQPTSRPTTQPNRPFDPSRQLAGVQGGNPVRRAQRAEFMAAMRQRMAQRGIQPGRGGGGWGGMGRGGGGGGGGGRRG